MRNIPSTPDELADAIFDTKEVKVKKTYVPNSKVFSNSSLKLVTESKTYRGKYGEYTITDGILTIMLNDNSNSLEKPNLEELILELNELGGIDVNEIIS